MFFCGNRKLERVCPFLYCQKFAILSITAVLQGFFGSYQKKNCKYSFYLIMSIFICKVASSRVKSDTFVHFMGLDYLTFVSSAAIMATPSGGHLGNFYFFLVCHFGNIFKQPYWQHSKAAILYLATDSFTQITKPFNEKAELPFL